MGYIKVLKTGAYMKRFQVKYRRRREGKTDYQARRRMVIQDKNKYNATKYRLCVRITNKDIICQIIQPKIAGDHCLCAAYSHELPKYGIEVGLTNYAACYATGLLVARRLLAKLELGDKYEGVEEADGEIYKVEQEDEDGPRPFTCVLDVGLVRTTTGNRVFGALKGAVDGGLHVPHSTKNFPGFKAPEEKGADPEYDAEAHKDRIFGGHVKEYMEMLAEEDPTKYEAHFAKYIEADIDADKLEDMYSEAHEKIKEDPDPEKKEAKEITHERKGSNVKSSDGTEHVRTVKLNLKQRRKKVAAKIRAAQEKMLAEDEE